MTNIDYDLKNKTFEELGELLGRSGRKKYLCKEVFGAIHNGLTAEVDGLEMLPGEFRRLLVGRGYYISQLKLVKKFTDPDGTVKYLFELPDGNRIETVLMFLKARKTVCISSQAGCRMGCDFCATAKLKFARSLTAAEIVDQVNRTADDVDKVDNVVYMGMGEPFDNFDETVRSLQILNHHAGQYIGQSHLTVSTCGIVEGIRKFAQVTPQCNLAISLHSGDPQQRALLMGSARKNSLDEIIRAVGDYQAVTNKRVMFEYCMIAGVNDGDRDAAALLKTLDGLKASVNLIEFNPYASSEFTPAGRERIKTFFDILMKANLETTIRYKRGEQINAACGQLGADWLK